MFIADPCALLAYFDAGDVAMSPTGAAAIRGNVSVPSITVREPTRKAASGKLPPLPTQQGRFARHLVALGFGTYRCRGAMPKLPKHCRRIIGDSMDRMLIATAFGADLTVITNDEMFPLYGVRTVW